MAKPFLRWVGGKRQLLDDIRNYYPEKIEKYCEPFVGGGAVFFDIMNTKKPKECLINDINDNLIITYKTIRDNLDLLLEELNKKQKEHNNSTDQVNLYYQNRVLFNDLRGVKNKEILRAALMLYLNKTCFNGLYRENKKGGFNVPFDKSKKEIVFDTENLKEVSKTLKDVDIRHGAYRDVDDFVDNKTFVYFDPPYRPISNTSAFDKYNRDGFGDEKQIELAAYFKELDKRGTTLLLSNSDPKSANEDMFFDEIYKEFNVKRVNASRAINSNAKKRGKVKEILVSNVYKKETK